MSTVVEEHLIDRRIHFERLPHRPVWTGIDEALALGESPDRVAKAIVVDYKGRHAVAIIPANRRLDMRRVRALLGDPHAHLASEEELARDYSTFELGALPPLGTVTRTVSYIDPELLEHETVVFAAGTRTESVRMRVEDLLREGMLRAKLT